MSLWQGKRRAVLVNGFWLLAERIGRIVIVGGVGIWSARYMGPKNFGAINYASAVVGLFAPLATLGLNELTVRELAQSPHERKNILGTVFLLQLVGTISTIAIVSLIALASLREEAQTFQLTLIFALATLGLPFNTFDLWYQSQTNTKRIAWVSFVALFTTSILRIGVILFEGRIFWFALIACLDALIVATGLLFNYTYDEGDWRRWRYQHKRAIKLLKEGFPLVFASLAVVIYMKIDQVFLREMVSEDELGIYSAAVRISELWYFIPMSVVTVISPTIIQLKNQGIVVYHRTFQHFLRLMAGMGVVVALLISVSAYPLIDLLYGRPYIDAAPILMVHTWGGIATALGVATTPWLLNEGLSIIALQRTVFGLIINLALNFLLIPHWHGMGAAIATVIAYFSAGVGWHFIHPKTRVLAKMQTLGLFGISSDHE